MLRCSWPNRFLKASRSISPFSLVPICSKSSKPELRCRERALMDSNVQKRSGLQAGGERAERPLDRNNRPRGEAEGGRESGLSAAAPAATAHVNRKAVRARGRPRLSPPRSTGRAFQRTGNIRRFLRNINKMRTPFSSPENANGTRCVHDQGPSLIQMEERLHKS